MSERELLHELLEEIRGLRGDIQTMTTANDAALAELQTAYSTLATDVAALLNAIAAAGLNANDDISAGVDAVTTGLGTLDADVTATTATLATPATPAAPAETAPAAPAPTPQPDATTEADAPVDVPAAPPAPTAG